MTFRSLSARLSLWYGIVCLVVCALLGVGTYLWLHKYMISTVAELVERRASQIAVLWGLPEGMSGEYDAVAEITYGYAPEKNDRFVRVSNSKGDVLYVSGHPADQSFDPSKIPLSWQEAEKGLRELPEQDMIIASQRFERGSQSYMVEVGTSLRPAERVLHAFLTMLLIGAPLVLLIAVSGGFILVQKSLQPVREITAAAQEITYSNPRRRLPVARTGDELENLSKVLNEMLTRLESAFVVSQRFGALASHELRTPLTIMIGELESALRDHSLSSESRERLESSYQEAERLIKIVEGLFAITRMEAGEARLESVGFDFSELVESTAEQMSMLAEDRGLTVRCDLEPALNYVGDKSRIKQVVVNLLDNAIKYSQPGGEVILQTRREKTAALVFRVIDHGSGVPLHALPHIFESFFRADDEATRQTEGTGLGLSIVRSICAAHGGAVTAENREGGGCEITVRLPLRKKPAQT